MAWTGTEGSHVFRAFLGDAMTRLAAFDLDTDTSRVALYNNTGTPDLNAVSASTAYNVGQWVTANEVFQAGQWAQAGIALGTPVVDKTTVSSVVFFDATDTASGSAATLTNAYGALVYDDTLTTPVADQGICFNYFGGANSVTNGTFTVVWNANGLWRATL